ncbi:hypothetical protein CVT26_002592 [Gymnopilus dilepis]|uniref:Heterokaryon incompatibility domain-containing protein n=1 Tax=Gymnopilus dilepis TaxID=231916 RepID=A0A409VF42_9AGAR|nr:hypothetical protein CVT26_002592 [Gymnopilus dilepis]
MTSPQAVPCLVFDDKEGDGVQEPPKTLDSIIFNDMPARLIHLPEMRLMNREDIRRYIAERTDNNSPEARKALAYAIFSHRWSENEPTFHEVSAMCEQSADASTAKEPTWLDQVRQYIYPPGPPPPVRPLSTGVKKLKEFCKLALAHGCEWAWSDTCCIDKDSSTELEEAIKAMFKWYANAKVCIVYLADVTDPERLEHSEWFRRGWTLQELLAPSNVHFYTKSWTPLIDDAGDLSRARSHKGLPWIGKKISKATGIPESVLSNRFDPRWQGLRHAREILGWASKRRTTRIEDNAYCLMGLLNIFIPIAYGEDDHAFYRLLAELVNSSNDIRLYFWSGFVTHARNTMFPKRLQQFLPLPHPDLGVEMDESATKKYGTFPEIFDQWLPTGNKAISLTNRGLSMSVPLYNIEVDRSPPNRRTGGLGKPTRIYCPELGDQNLPLWDNLSLYGVVAILNYDDEILETALYDEEYLSRFSLSRYFHEVYKLGEPSPQEVLAFFREVREKRAYTAVVLWQDSNLLGSRYKRAAQPLLFVRRPKGGFKAPSLIFVE